MKFNELWSNYSHNKSDKRVSGTCKSYENQCAMRLISALAKGYFKIENNYGSPVCVSEGVKHARGSKSLADYLWKRLGRPNI